MESPFRIRFIAAASLTLMGLSLFLIHCSQSQKEGSQPRVVSTHRDVNVLLITVDTLRADYLSCYGGKIVPTSNMDALASRGVRFAQAFAQVPLTAPSHACILTGTYPPVHKLRDNGGFILDSGVPTLASITQQAGFETAAFVAAAVLDHYYGLNRGFNSYIDEMTTKRGKGALPGVVPEVRAEIITGRALNWLDTQLQRGVGRTPMQNFFLWVHYYDPHFPYDPPAPYRTRYAKNLYGGEVAYADAQVGVLLKGLADRGLQERTLVVLMGDHGESLGEHGEYTHGVFLYDSTLHIPLIMAGPGLAPKRVITQQLRTIDIMPTIVQWLGLSPGDKAQGVSIVPALTQGKVMPTTFAYSETIYPKTNLGWSELRAVRTPEYKLIQAPTPELYQLETDPGESRNVTHQYSEEVAQLQKKIQEVRGADSAQGILERQPISSETLRQLQSLGYATAGAGRDLRLDMSGPDPKDRVQVLEIIERSSRMINQHHYRSALPLLQGAVHSDPTNPFLYHLLGLCLQQLGQFQQAVQIFQQAIANKVDTDQMQAELGNSYLQLGDLQRAVDAMETAAGMNMADLQNLTNLATLYLQLRRPADAERTLRAILAEDDRYAEAYNLLGTLEIQRGQAELARGHFEKAVEYDPDLAEVYVNLGLLAENAGQPQQAVAYYKKFLEKADPRKHGPLIPKIKAAISSIERGQ
ncbi:MAG TPA: sulfatase-like hydrolase/transferase [Terriglobia bacterium]|nr:sulfatase-like hydrolase/transferase [Terriglobia bacterium]